MLVAKRFSLKAFMILCFLALCLRAADPEAPSRKGRRLLNIGRFFRGLFGRKKSPTAPKSQAETSPRTKQTGARPAPKKKTVAPKNLKQPVDPNVFQTLKQWVDANLYPKFDALVKKEATAIQSTYTKGWGEHSKKMERILQKVGKKSPKGWREISKRWSERGSDNVQNAFINVLPVSQREKDLIIPFIDRMMQPELKKLQTRVNNSWAKTLHNLRKTKVLDGVFGHAIPSNGIPTEVQTKLNNFVNLNTYLVVKRAVDDRLFYLEEVP